MDILHRVERDLGAKCPHCKKPYRDEYTAGIVIATGNCPGCGKRVIDPESSSIT